MKLRTRHISPLKVWQLNKIAKQKTVNARVKLALQKRRGKK